MKKFKSIFHRVLIFAFFLGILLANTQAQAIIAQAIIIEYPSRSAFGAAVALALVQDWDSFNHGDSFPNGTADNKGITYYSSYGNAMVTTEFLVSTEPNGLGQTVDGYFLSIDTIRFVFGTPIRAFGIDINTNATTDSTYKATTDLGDVVFSFYNVFPGSDFGQFLGFTSTEAFSEVTIALSQGAAPFSYTLDTLRYQPVPLPPSLLLLGSGLAGLGLLRFRKHFKS